MLKNAKAVVKYLDPNYLPCKTDHNIDALLKLLDKDWIEKNGPQWLPKYNSAKKIKNYIESGKRVQREKGIKFLIKRIFK
jgi:hypothetical protein